MVVQFYIDKKRTTMCKHGSCTDKQLEVIKLKIRTKFASNLVVFVIKLANGVTVSIKVKICSFEPSKRNES